MIGTYQRDEDMQVHVSFTFTHMGLLCWCSHHVDRFGISPLESSLRLKVELHDMIIITSCLKT